MKQSRLIYRYINSETREVFSIGTFLQEKTLPHITECPYEWKDGTLAIDIVVFRKLHRWGSVFLTFAKVENDTPHTHTWHIPTSPHTFNGNTVVFRARL